MLEFGMLARRVTRDVIMSCIRFNLRQISVTKSLSEEFREIDKVIPKNTLKKYYTAAEQPKSGVMYDPKPFKLKLSKDKTYAWCSCGQSKSQPLCDRTHKIETLNITMRPVFFKVEETKEYWLCNCKQTSHRPFCDGSHIKIQKEIERKNLEKLALSKPSSS